MTEVPDESVHLVVTSPPYWQLKDYGHEDQIGFDDTYEDYVNNLNLVWDECRRVLHPGCRLCVNIGDQFARSVYYGRYKVIPIRTEIIKFCESIGFDFMGSIVWRKVTTTNTTGGAVIMGSYPYPRNGILKIDYEHILLFKKLGEAPKPTLDQKHASKLADEEWNIYFSGHWNFPGERQDRHLAMFPEELPRRLIKMFTFIGETVLDPFLGSGTTSRAAYNLGRNSIGYEVNPEFLPVIRSKICGRDNNLFEAASEIEVCERRAHPDNRKERLAAFPYVFQDFVRVEKQVDPRTLDFGSKISADSRGARVR
ncbi:MAG: site-specific DNA-methyltransferase [Armatimonadetes bacterium]|nr:site-specific DNA-methyltransferase [Armatimonadota bacterium]